MAGDTTKAKVVYQDFLTLCKDADPDIPILNGYSDPERSQSGVREAKLVSYPLRANAVRVTRRIALGEDDAAMALSCFALAVGAAWRVQAQDVKTMYPSMAPLDPYLVADRNLESQELAVPSGHAPASGRSAALSNLL
jgi:hypothetical protein